MTRRETIEAALDKLARVRVLTAQKLKLLDELERTLTHQWAKEAGVNTIHFTEVKFSTLKRAYERATKDGETQFKFEGHDVLVSYAKYLIEYLTSHFPRVR